jgi:hypothetical protein
MAAISIAGWQKPEGVSRETSNFPGAAGTVSRETEGFSFLLIG